MILIFDLDETLINSAHRTPNNADGTLNLTAYIEKHTRDNVFKDTLLPLARFFKKAKRPGIVVWIVTARDMADFDYDYLTQNGIVADKIMSRDRVRFPSHYRESDGKYKIRWIKSLLNLKQYKNRHVVIFDDAAPVLREMRKIGITALNAIKINRKLKGK